MKLRTWTFLAVAGLLLSGTGLQRAVAQSGITQQNGRNVTCASDDGRRHYCGVNTNGGVRLTNQRSGSPCIQGQTWGWDRSGIWVDRGCRADFVLGGGGGPGYGPGYGPGPGYPGNGGYYPPGPGNGYPPPPGGGNSVVTCSSNDGGRKFCNAYTGRGVSMVNQRSGSPCVQGQTWGYTNRGIWVDRGCRADFAVGR